MLNANRQLFQPALLHMRVSEQAAKRVYQLTFQSRDQEVSIILTQPGTKSSKILSETQLRDLFHPSPPLVYVTPHTLEFWGSQGLSHLLVAHSIKVVLNLEIY